MNTNPNAKSILCFGDSNTWGNIPWTDDRYPADVRWTGVLQNLLGNGYEVIEEGLCGRTIVATQEGKPWKTGITHLKAIIQSHEPLDTVIVMLGTNDTKDRYNLSAEGIANHLQQAIDLIRAETAISTRILIICPPAIVEPSQGELKDKIKRGIEIFKLLPSLYKNVAEKNNCLFVDAGENMRLENTDGFHMDAGHHHALAKLIASHVI